MKTLRKKILRGGEKGQTISEAVMCMLFICLVLFGLLQIFYIFVAQMITDYSAFCAARSRSVGFADYLVSRNARVAAIGASGPLVYPEGAEYNTDPLSLFAAERVRIPEYMQGSRWLEYEYWGTNSSNEENTSLGISAGTDTTPNVQATVSFRNYPFNFPMRAAFSGSETLDISKQAEVMNYATHYVGGE